MQLQKRTVLNEIEKNQINELVRLCNQHDKTYTQIYLSNQFNYYPDLPAFFLAYDGESLAGILNIYADEAEDAEIKALVRPEKRRQGVFHAMWQEAQEELKKKEYHNVLYVVDRCFTDYEKCMAALAGAYTESEYYMVWEKPDIAREIKETAKNGEEQSANGQRNVRPAKTEDIPVLAQIAAAAFEEDIAVQLKYETESLQDPEIDKLVIEQDGQIAGGCSVGITPELNYIFGLCISPERQHQGLGKTMLKGVIAYLHSQGRENIALSVVTDNENALRLYEGCGFVTKTANLYYKAIIG